MKSIYSTIIISLVIAIFSGCDNHEDLDKPENPLEKRTTEDIVIIPRALNMPDVDRFKRNANDRKQPIFNSTRGPVIANDSSLLGRSYKVGNSIIGDYSNVGAPIIDLAKVEKKGKNRINSYAINHQDVKTYTYYNFDRFADSTSITKKIASGFSINLILFKIGRKKLTTEIFKSAFTSSNESVYGELNILCKKNKFELNATSAALQLYARECLTEEFRHDFHNSPVGKTLVDYGPYVMTAYETGGKALGLYAAKTVSGASYSLHEKNLKDSISASFSVNNDSLSAEVSLKFKMNNGHVSTSQQVLKNTELQIRTYGGRNNSGAIIGPVETKNMSIDLTDWLKSLSDVNTHTLIDICERGLVPLSTFFIEKNFKNRIEDTAVEYLETLEKLKEPYIEVVRVYARSSNGKRLYEIAPVLNTRQGDKIVLSSGTYKQMSDEQLAENSNDSYYLSKVTEIALQKNNFFNGIAYKQNVTTWLDPYDRKPLCLRLDGFDEAKAYKYVREDLNVGYIYIPTAKVALSYYISEDEGDYILDDYGIRDWVEETLPEKNISLTSLVNYYTIIGL